MYLVDKSLHDFPNVYSVSSYGTWIESSYIIGRDGTLCGGIDYELIKVTCSKLCKNGILPHMYLNMSRLLRTLPTHLVPVVYIKQWNEEDEDLPCHLTHDNQNSKCCEAKCKSGLKYDWKHDVQRCLICCCLFPHICISK